MLFDVSISLDKGSTVALVGESGCGKTTLGTIAADVVRATDGSVRYHDRDIHRLSKAGDIDTGCTA